MCNIFLTQKDKMWKEIVNNLQNQIVYLETEMDDLNKKERMKINQVKNIFEFNKEMEK